MRFSHLRTFRAVYENMGVSAAAKKLNISQPPVTRMLRNFEESVGLELFRRERGRLVPTPEADHLYQEAVELFRQIDRFNQAADDARSGRWRALNLSCALPLGYALFPAVLMRVQKRYPEWPLHVRTADLRDQMAGIFNGELDISVTFEAPRRTGLRRINLGESGIVLVTPGKHPLAGKSSVSITDIREREVISGPIDSPLRMALDRVVGSSEKITSKTIVSQSIALTIQMISRGMGIGLLDTFSVAAFAGPDVAVMPLKEPIPFSVEALTKSDRRLSTKEDELLDELRREIARVKH